MLTKGAFGNLVNRYRAVLKKCNLINTFGSLAVASMLVLGGAGVASAADFAIETKNNFGELNPSVTGKSILTLGGSDTYNSWWVRAGQSTADEVTGYTDIIYSGTYWNPAVDCPGENPEEAADGVFMAFAPGVLKIYDVKNIYTKNNTNDRAIFFNAFSGNIDVDVETINLDGVQHAVASRKGSEVLIETSGDFSASTVLHVISVINDGDASNIKLISNKNINLNAASNMAGINVRGAAGSFVDIHADEKITINGSNAINVNGGAGAYVKLDAKEIEINNNGDYNALRAKNGKIIITPTSKAVINGNILAEGSNSEISVTFGKGGSLTGAVSTASSCTTTLDFGTDSTWNVTGDSTVTELKGSGTIVVDSVDATITATNNGSFTAKGSAKLNDQTGGDLAQVKNAVNGLNVEVTGMEEGLIAGAVDANGNQKTNTVMQDTLDMVTAAPLAIGRIVMNDVRKRMGDLRDTKEESGVWMRWEGGKLKGDAGLTNNFNTIQIGADTMTGIENVRAGVAAAFTHGDIDHNNGEGENETYSFSAYATWMAENGMFADVIARVGFSNSEVTMKDTRIDLDNEALSLSGEYGWRLPVCEQFYVEPQVELTYTYVTGADSKVQYATYDVDSMDSLIGRAGLVAGWKLPDDMGSVYARASVVHEFLGDAKITGSALGNSIDLETDGKDTWIEYGIGANVKLTDKTYIWADVERTSGADIDEEWRGTVGLRYSF